MQRDYLVILFIIGCSVLLILIFVRKNNIKKVFFSALVAQFFTWPIGISIAYLGKIEYPVRLFPKAVDSSFLHGYISNPLIYAMYYLHYPKQVKLIWRCVYTLLFTGIPISIEIIENNYTNLINYKNWSGYYSWIVIVISYFIIRKYLDWFFKNISKQGVSVNET